MSQTSADDGPGTGSEAITEMIFWFGECEGMCIRHLFLNADRSVEFVGTNHQGDELMRNGGNLTDAGAAALAVIEADLSGVELDERYGCPDCDDGGGITVTRLSATNDLESSNYEAGDPPAELQAIHAFSRDALQALRACEDHAMVDVDDDCVPE